MPTLLVFWDLDTLKKFNDAVYRTLKNKVKVKKKDRSCVELKASKTSIGIKKYFYKQLPENGWGLYSYILNKDVISFYGHDKHRLYNFIAGQLLKKIEFSDGIKTINFVVDRSKSNQEMRKFNDHILNQIESKISLDVRVSINHQSSELTPGIQATDLFSWGFYRKYNQSDTEWYNLFKSRIFFEQSDK